MARNAQRREALAKLGAFLRQAREDAGGTLRDLEPVCSPGYASAFERGKHLPNREIIKSYIKQFGADEKELKELCLEASNSENRDNKTVASQNGNTSAAAPPQPLHRTATSRLTRDSIERTTVYEGRHLREIITSRTVRAIIDGISSDIHRYALWSDPQSVRVTAVSGCRVQSSEFKGDHLETRLRLSRTLKANERHTYILKTTCDTLQESDDFTRITNTSGCEIKEVTLRLQFNSAPPSIIWPFRTTSMLASPEEPTADETFSTDQGGYFEHTFLAVEPGERTGIAWKWPDTSDTFQ